MRGCGRWQRRRGPWGGRSCLASAPARSPATDNKALFVDILMRLALPEQQEALKREMREVQQQKVQGVITSAREVLLPRMQKIMGADKWRVATLEYKQAMNRR